MILLSDYVDSSRLPAPQQCSTVLSENLKVANKNLLHTKSLIFAKYTIHKTINNWVLSRIEELSRFQNAWDGIDAIAPSEFVILKANRFVNICTSRGQKIYNCVPGLDGEIMFELRNEIKGKSIEVIYYGNRTIVVQFGPNNFTKQSKIESSNEIINAIIWLNT
jgi:hypothetical protein